MVRFRARLHIAISLVGQKQTCAAHKPHVRFVPQADITAFRKSGSVPHRRPDRKKCGLNWKLA